MASKVEIYTTMFCPYCYRAKALLKSKGVDFTEYDVGGSSDARTRMRERADGRHTVPQVFIDGVAACPPLPGHTLSIYWGFFAGQRLDHVSTALRLRYWHTSLPQC